MAETLIPVPLALLVSLELFLQKVQEPNQEPTLPERMIELQEEANVLEFKLDHLPGRKLGPALPEAADCPSCQPCRNAALIRCRDCGKTFTPCPEYLIPGEVPERNVACCLAKGHAGPHQDTPLPRRRWTS